MWYVAEVAAEANTDAGSGVVEVAWDRDTTIFDYDPTIYDRLLTYLHLYWPVKTVASHVCCSPRITRRLVHPILHALLTPWSRSRTDMHNVPESEIINVLSRYGILKEMLPTEMGGTLELNSAEWIAQRRAAEMEEL